MKCQCLCVCLCMSACLCACLCVYVYVCLCVAAWLLKVRRCWCSTAVLLSAELSSETTSSWLVRRDWRREVLLNRCLLSCVFDVFHWSVAMHIHDMKLVYIQRSVLWHCWLLTGKVFDLSHTCCSSSYLCSIEVPATPAVTPDKFEASWTKTVGSIYRLICYLSFLLFLSLHCR